MHLGLLDIPANCSGSGMTPQELREAGGNLVVHLQVAGHGWRASLSHLDGRAILWNFRRVSTSAGRPPESYHLSDSEIARIHRGSDGLLVAELDLRPVS